MASYGADLIAGERRRQVEEEGWTPEHDDRHTDRDLAVVAAALAIDGTDYFIEARDDGGVLCAGGSDRWGLVAKFGYCGERPDRIRALTIAGALIAAEIDRELRRQAGGGEGGAS